MRTKAFQFIYLCYLQKGYVEISHQGIAYQKRGTDLDWIWALQIKLVTLKSGQPRYTLARQKTYLGFRCWLCKKSQTLNPILKSQTSNPIPKTSNLKPYALNRKQGKNPMLKTESLKP